VLIRDQLNLTGTSPMLGPAPPSPYPARFADVTAIYSQRLRDLAHSVDPSLPEGVYAGLLGGAYETPSEVQMLRLLGADLVGMSTALEAIAAVHLGAEVMGVSLVTNLAAGMSSEPLEHTAVVAAGTSAAAGLGVLLRQVIERL
jgi:purine-nucleoside phosphorylase